VAGGYRGDNYVAPTPPEEIARKCVLIPIHLVKDFIAAWKNDDLQVTIAPQLPDVTHELSTKGNDSNPPPDVDLRTSNSSSYLSKKEITNLKEASDIFNNQESRNDNKNCVKEKVHPDVETVTRSIPQSGNLDTVRNTSSYLNVRNKGAIAPRDRVTESQETNAVEKKTFTSDESDSCDGRKETSTKLVDSTNENVDAKSHLNETQIMRIPTPHPVISI
jgi:hypothetical protein